MTPCRRSNFDPLRLILGLSEPREMKGCYPWRTGLRSAGCIERRVTDQGNRAVAGCFEEHGAGGDRLGCAAEVSAYAGRVDRRRGRAAYSSTASGVSEDAGDGNRGTDRLAAWANGVQGTGRRTAFSLSAAGSGRSHELRRRRDRAVRSVVPADQPAGRVRADPPPGAAAGVDDDHRLL